MLLKRINLDKVAQFMLANAKKNRTIQNKTLTFSLDTAHHLEIPNLVVMVNVANARLMVAVSVQNLDASEIDLLYVGEWLSEYLSV